MTDPVADMLTRIRNAHLANKKSVAIPHSGLLQRLLDKLVDLNYLDSYTIQGEGTTKILNAKLIYKNGQAVITTIRRISKPGRRIYSKSADIPTTLSGHGSMIISTSQGLLTDQEAKTAGIGGEIICQIW